MIRMDDLNQYQLDVLKEIGNIGAGHAATALSQLLSEKIKMSVPSVSIVPLSKVSDILGGPEQPVVGIYMRVYGDVPSKIIFIFSQEESLILTDMVTGSLPGTTREISEYEESALKEIGNIMTGAYLYAITKLTGFNCLPSVPAFACDMAGALLNTALVDLGTIGDFALLIETQFSLTQRKINGHFFLVPDPGALDGILSALGVGTEWKK